MNPPKGATHSAEFYDRIDYYKKIQTPHLNQVSEEWETLTRYEVWDRYRWIDVGRGFSPRRLEELP